MKMTRQEVADLLLRMNEDLSNVELFDGGWRLSNKVLGDILFNISNGIVYRIKDNSVKEITLDLFDRVVVSKDGREKGRVTYVYYDKEFADDNYVSIGGSDYDLKEFNDNWQLVED